MIHEGSSSFDCPDKVEEVVRSLQSDAQAHFTLPSVFLGRKHFV